ncbi:YhcB family protein [Wenzhouxiangella limi]|uniref:Z-ring associated protein G n=1 Tax=Wenzhouxiangella limi TaxID=2707351 RepID=A0A845UZR3_9GAMM|nr:DUF1043 family protein [Wenzhouxiangella limi]NDY94546.1 DUF1043 family protein [Wenzhouxiangella limi]
MWAGITGVIIGLLIGGTAVAIWLKKRGGAGESVASLKRENAQFREEVNEHFVQTAELINQLTDSYKAVFDHLSEGAEKLVEPDVVRDRMPQVTDEEVRLKRIGSPRAVDETDQAAAAGSNPVQDEEPEPAQTPDGGSSDAEQPDEARKEGAEHDSEQSASAEEPKPSEDFEESEKPEESSQEPSETKHAESDDQPAPDDDEKDRHRGA